jgi:hypothetical protein
VRTTDGYYSSFPAATSEDRTQRKHCGPPP